jgi:acyl dehydratase
MSGMAEDDWQAAWDPVVALVGSDLSRGEARAGADAVEAGAIRRWLEPLEFDCALHSDPSVARAHGHPDVIAPYTSVGSFAMAAVRAPGQEIFVTAGRDAQPVRGGGAPRLPPGAPPVTGYLATDLGVDWLRPVHVGEHLARRGNRLIACEPKETRLGRGAFIKTESLVLDAAAQTVARYHTGLFLYDPAPRDRGANSQRRAATAPDPGAGPVAAETRGDRAPIGDRLGPLAFPITVYRLVMAAGANRDFNPMHHNAEIARRAGAPDMYANSLFLQGMWERLVRGYIGPAGVIRQLAGFRMNSFNAAGDTVTVQGEVTECWDETEWRCARIRLWSLNGARISVGPGTMTVAWPR